VQVHAYRYRGADRLRGTGAKFMTNTRFGRTKLSTDLSRSAQAIHSKLSARSQLCFTKTPRYSPRIVRRSTALNTDLGLRVCAIAAFSSASIQRRALATTSSDPLPVPRPVCASHAAIAGERSTKLLDRLICVAAIEPPQSRPES